MLAMTRKVGEAFRVGDAVVTIMKTAGKTVKVSIEAPSTLLILREELLAPEPPAGLPGLNRVALLAPRLAK